MLGYNMGMQHLFETSIADLQTNVKLIVRLTTVFIELVALDSFLWQHLYDLYLF